MRLRRILSRSLALSTFALVLAGSAAAQQYQILRADYGYGKQRIDVTQRLRDLARSNASFRMGNSTFGVDPSPGNVKTLRIHARGPGGNSRVFEYREGSIVDGSQFSGWGGGRWGDTVQYQILGAWYRNPEEECGRDPTTARPGKEQLIFPVAEQDPGGGSGAGQH